MVSIKELRIKGKELKPLVNIGKNGVTPSVVAQVKRILQIKKLIKVKFLRSFVDSQEGKTTRMIAKELADSINATVVEVVGMVVVLAKK